MNEVKKLPHYRMALDDFVSKAQHLVPAPHVLPQLLSLLNRPDINTNKIVELISYDPALTANVMRICNSAYYNRGTPIDSLQHAVMHLGLNEIYRIVVAITGSFLLRQSKGNRVDAESDRLWHHSVISALAAQIVAKDAGEDEDVVFTAALLHDIGKLVFAAEVQDLYEFRVSSYDRSSRSLVEIEKELFGHDHAELGGRLMEAWRFPAHLVAVVRFHHQIADATTFVRLTACVSLGDYLAYVFGHGYGRNDPPVDDRDRAVQILNIPPEHLSKYEGEIRPRLQALKDIYQLKF